MDQADLQPGALPDYSIFKARKISRRARVWSTPSSARASGGPPPVQKRGEVLARGRGAWFVGVSSSRESHGQPAFPARSLGRASEARQPGCKKIQSSDVQQSAPLLHKECEFLLEKHHCLRVSLHGRGSPSLPLCFGYE